MNVIFEFLCKEPIENLITSLHFKVDKVVYFGYQEVIDDLKICTMNFLSKYCGVHKAAFYSLTQGDMQTMMDEMRNIIEGELREGNRLYFDMTGGEDQILTAFGLLAGEYDTPLHIFDVNTDTITRLEEGSEHSIITELESRDLKLTLDMIIEMHGGRINYSLHKDVKSLDDPEFAEDIEKLWSVEKDYIEEWNLLSIFLRNHMMPEYGLDVNCELDKVERNLKRANNHLDSLEKFNALMDRLGEQGILKDLRHSDGIYSFSYKSKAVKDCLKEGGSVLELYIFKREKEHTDDCRVGVHLDWDGVIHYSPGVDVVNEIDVLTLKGNIPTFISCKTGKMGPTNSLHALYELQTVADRFGGKYAKKVLVTSRPLVDVYLKRAQEMGIEVEQ